MGMGAGAPVGSRPASKVKKGIGMDVVRHKGMWLGVLAAAALLAGAGFALAANNEDVWVVNVGQPAGTGHTQDPHLACQNINLWGSGLVNGSGTFTIDGYPPSGNHEQVYADSWSYNTATGGSQVIQVIDVGKLIRTAIANGDTPASGGFHFYLQFVQTPQKHKTFWVNCGVPSLSTVASSGPVGGTIQDAATLSGGNNPTGTMTWNLYGPADPTCSTSIQTLTMPVAGDGTYNSPTFEPTSAGTYLWVASYSGDGNNLSTSGACNDPNESSTVTQASPTLKSDAVSGTIGGVIHDVAHLTGGFDPTGKITWNVYALADSTCSTPLNASPIFVTVNDDGDYTSPDFPATIAGGYQWVATYSGDTNNVSVATTCGDPNEVSTVTNAAAPGVALHKVERIGSSGSFTHGPVTGNVGDTVNYQITVTNTGNTDLVVKFTDTPCAGTLSAPTVLHPSYDPVTKTLSSGGELLYTCSHVLAAGDQPFANSASVIGTPPVGPSVSSSDSVKASANVPGISVVKLEKVASAGGGFTAGPITVDVGTPGHYIVHTIDYEIQVTNTGNVPLTLSLDDSLCDPRTVRGPAVLTGTLVGNVLSPGGKAQYTCTHRLLQSDPGSFTNTATVTGDPPTGPPVTGTGTVTANKHSNPAAKHTCRDPRTGKVYHYTGSHKPAACHAARRRLHRCRDPRTGRTVHYHGHRKPAACRVSRRPRRPNGFTG
jgi:uncharacterized repeat protein (TIGR01451 family)